MFDSMANFTYLLNFISDETIWKVLSEKDLPEKTNKIGADKVLCKLTRTERKNTIKKKNYKNYYFLNVISGYVKERM